MCSLWVELPVTQKKIQETEWQETLDYIYMGKWDQFSSSRGRERADQMWNGVHTYPSVEGRHVKMSAGCKHREQRDWELWTEIADIYGFSSWKPHRPTEWQIHMLKSEILHYRLQNHIHQSVSVKACHCERNHCEADQNDWYVRERYAYMNILALQHNLVQKEIIYLCLQTETAETHFSKASQWEWFTDCYNTWAKMKVNVIQSHTRLLKDLSWPFKADSNHRKLSSSAPYVMMFCGQRPASKEVCEYQHVKRGGQILSDQQLILSVHMCLTRYTVYIYSYQNSTLLMHRLDNQLDYCRSFGKLHHLPFL